MNIGSLKLPGKNGSSAWLHMQSGLLGALACSFIEQGQDIKREESQSQSTRLRCHTSRAVARLPVRQRHLRRCKGSKKVGGTEACMIAIMAKVRLIDGWHRHISEAAAKSNMQASLLAPLPSHKAV